jgi:Flp pilus assembly protein TadG
MKFLIHKLRNADGAEIAEAALVMPVVFIFLLGIVWFGRAFNIYSTITQAAQQGAITAARPSCATCGAGNPFPTDTTVTNVVFAVMRASSLDPAQILPPNSIQPPAGCTTTSNVTICREVLLNATQPQVCDPSSTQPQICGTQVSFRYPFLFYLPFTSLNLNQVIMNAQAQSRMEN